MGGLWSGEESKNLGKERGAALFVRPGEGAAGRADTPAQAGRRSFSGGAEVLLDVGGRLDYR